MRYRKTREWMRQIAQNAIKAYQIGNQDSNIYQTAIRILRAQAQYGPPKSTGK